MDWEPIDKGSIVWSGEISNLSEKKRIAQSIADNVKSGDIIGFGSGSTSFLASLAIGERIKNEGIQITAIPTSYEILVLCSDIGIPVTSLLHSRPDWCFDGVDEIDQDGNMIKGRGGALFTEKLVMKSSQRVFILADKTKLVPYLGFSFPVPIEVHPNALTYVKSQLKKFNTDSVSIRMAKGKDGPIITEHGNIILDVKFDRIYPSLEAELSEITGVFESGLFCGIHPEILLS